MNEIITVERVCVGCKRLFSPKQLSQKYCALDCKNITFKAHNKELIRINLNRKKQKLYYNKNRNLICKKNRLHYWNNGGKNKMRLRYLNKYLQMANNLIDSFIKFFELPTFLKYKALRIYLKAIDANLVKGRNHKLVILSCIYFVRFHKRFEITSKDIASFFSVNLKSFRNHHRTLILKLKLDPYKNKRKGITPIKSCQIMKYDPVLELLKTYENDLFIKKDIEEIKFYILDICKQTTSKNINKSIKNILASSIFLAMNRVYSVPKVSGFLGISPSPVRILLRSLQIYETLLDS